MIIANTLQNKTHKLPDLQDKFWNRIVFIEELIGFRILSTLLSNRIEAAFFSFIIPNFQTKGIHL